MRILRAFLGTPIDADFPRDLCAAHGGGAAGRLVEPDRDSGAAEMIRIRLRQRLRRDRFVRSPAVGSSRTVVRAGGAPAARQSRHGQRRHHVARAVMTSATSTAQLRGNAHRGDAAAIHAVHGRFAFLAGDRAGAASRVSLTPRLTIEGGAQPVAAAHRRQHHRRSGSRGAGAARRRAAAVRLRRRADLAAADSHRGGGWRRL